MSYLRNMNRMIFLFALCACLAMSCVKQQDCLKTGDLIFVGIPADYSLDDSSMDSAIAVATGSPDSLNLIHVAIAEVEDGQPWIIDATIKYGVDRHPLDSFLTQFTLKDGSLPVFQVMRLQPSPGRPSSGPKSFSARPTTSRSCPTTAPSTARNWSRSAT